MARPRGAALGSASAILAMPVLAEKRTVAGTSCLKCNALLTLAASALGTNVPRRTMPLAWAARCVVCLPNAELSASTNDSGVVAIAGSFRVFIAAPFPIHVTGGDGIAPAATRIAPVGFQMRRRSESGALADIAAALTNVIQIWGRRVT